MKRYNTLKTTCLTLAALSCLGIAPASTTDLSPNLSKGWPWSTQRREPTTNDSDLGRPTSRRGGQGRNPSDCVAYPVALVPGNGEINIQTEICAEQPIPDSSYAATPAYIATEQATLWVYVPAYNNPQPLTAKVNLIDNWREKGRWEIPIQSTAGILCFTVPYTLQADNTYAWEFEILLSPNDAAANPKVSGFITYTQQAEEYWYDALKTAIQQRQQTGSDQMLTTMLEPHGLASLATETLPESCHTD